MGGGKLMGREIGYVRVHAHFSFINPLSHAFENVTKRIFAVTFRLASFSFWRNYIFIEFDLADLGKLNYGFISLIVFIYLMYCNFIFD
jgi:hypothetical protein